jgi:TonB-dependent receptor
MTGFAERSSYVRYARRGLLAATASSALAFTVATPAIAQDASSGANGPAPQAGSTPATDDGDVIVVTGLRASLQRNLDAKRAAPGVVDVISAEDIGKFPDSNVASAMQRLPGVSIQRSGARGEATGITVRGFGGDFNDTLYDGRHISTATGGRGVDFTTVGADFVGQINVLKTPDVELSTSAIGSTINVQLPKPFDYSGLKIAGMAAGTIQSRDGSVRPRAGLLFSDTFADGRFGILADIAYTREDTQSNHVFIPGWVGAHFAPCQTGPINRTCLPTSNAASAAWADPNNRKSVLTWFPQQIGAEQVTTRDERIDGRIALQWQPSDNLLLTLDDNYSDQKVTSNSYGYAAWFNGDDLRNVKYDSNGSVVDFNQFGTPMDFNANHSRTITRTNQAGANLKWDATENLKFEADGAYAKSIRNPGRNGIGDSMDIGYGGYNNDPAGPFCSSGGCVSTVLGAPTGVTINGPSSKFLPSVHDVGPANNLSQFLDTTKMGSHVIVRIDPYNTDTVTQAKLLGRWESDAFKLTFGGQYIDDEFYQESASTFANGVFASFAGYGTPSGRTGGLWPLPAGAFDGSVSTSNFIPGYDSSAVAPGFVVYDPYAIYSALEAAGHNTKPGFDPGSVLSVEEKTLSFFMKANFVTDIAGMPFHFDAGLREESTHLDVSAIGRSITALTVDPGDPTLITPTYSASQDIVGKSHYSYLLPSFDMKLELTPSLIFRLDASRTLTRPQLGALKPTVNFGSLRRGSLSGSGGNPDLKPYLSDNFDAGLEWYYASNSYFAIDGFYKHLTNFIVGGVHQQSYSGIIDPFTGQEAVFNVNGQVNGPDADVRGIEIALQHVFGNSGFGFQANATFVDTNRKFPTADTSGTAFAITGLANSANFVAFYDKNGFQIRGAVNWRDKYLLGLGQGQGGTFGAEPVYVDKQLQIDASTSYDVTDQFSVFAEVTNINNSTYSTHGRFSDQPLDAWHYGRRYTAGVRFRFGAAPSAPPPPVAPVPAPVEVAPPPPPAPAPAAPPPPAVQPTGERG